MGLYLWSGELHMLSHCIKAMMKLILTTIDWFLNSFVLLKSWSLFVNNQLNSFFEIYPVLCPHQSGFRAKHSPVPAITSDRLLYLLLEGKYCAARSVNPAKAFDTAGHALLIQRLSYVGFCNWFKSYSQTTVCDCRKWSLCVFPIVYRGFTRFYTRFCLIHNMYSINTSTSSTTNCKDHNYLDDTILHCFAKTAPKAITVLQLLANCRTAFLTWN